MIYNSNLDRQATEIVKEIDKINFEYGGKIPKDKIDKMSANLIVNFGIELCEKQKGNKNNICESIFKTI